jgi:hypothetical protein
MENDLQEIEKMPSTAKSGHDDRFSVLLRANSFQKWRIHPRSPHFSTTGKGFDAVRTQHLNAPGHLRWHGMTHIDG